MKNIMTKEELEFIISEGEGQFIEFKEKLDKTLAKEIVAFANASGGRIFLGITDNGKIIGIDADNRLKSQIQDIARNCDPSIAIEITHADRVVIINVNEGINKPYSCSNGFFMRIGANSQKLKRDEILSFAIKSGRVRFDEQICESFDWHDFDNDKFSYYLKLARISEVLERDEILFNLNLLTKTGLTNAGVLLFAKEPYKYIKSSKIRCVHFRGHKRIDILDKKEVDKGIIGNIEFAVNYLKERVPVEFVIETLKRKELPEYPEDVYREAIVNAVIHRDYFDFNGDIAIEKPSDRIFINNPGGIIFSKEDFGRRSYPRNRLLADVLSRTEFMEKAGTGIQRMREECLKNSNRIKIQFTDIFYDLTIFSNTYTPQKTPQKEDTRSKIVKLMQEQPEITTTTIARELNISRDTVNEHISRLKKRGILERVGGRKVGYWKVKEI
jgi:ATP-dependent DNA helicase RecG